jgi:hypothetical protein
MTTSPFGSWKSPITSALLTSSGIGFSELRFSNGNVYWLESRPEEAGRVAIVRSRKDSQTEDAISSGFNVRTRAHEYGGGAYCLYDSTIFFSNYKDQRLYRIEKNGAAQPITFEPPLPASVRYSDGRVTPDGNTLICVRERHEGGREAINEIVAIPTDGRAPARIILAGYDFYSFPRISANGKKLAWTCWRHPQMPWDGSELWVGDLGLDGSVSNSRRIAGSNAESVFQPEWAPDGALYFISDRTGWWNLYAVREDSIQPVFDVNAETGIPQWVFGQTRYAFLSDGRVACVVAENAFEHIVVVDTRTQRRQRLLLPYSAIVSIDSDGADMLFVAGASTSTAPEVSAVDVRSNKLRVLKRSLDVAIDPGYIAEP